jgi:hypothetical protein
MGQVLNFMTVSIVIEPCWEGESTWLAPSGTAWLMVEVDEHLAVSCELDDINRLMHTLKLTCPGQ